MAYPNQGTLRTDRRQVNISSTWDSDADWNNYQSKTDITVSGGALQLTEIVTIPNSIVLLDDWADGNLTSNRDDYNTTAFQPSNSTLVQQGASGSLSRPTWTIDQGSPFVNSQVLTVRTSSGTGDRARAPLSLASLDNVTWELEINGVGGLVYYNLVMTTTTYNSNGYTQNGYFMNIEDTGISLYSSNGGSVTNMITGLTTPSTPFVLRVERDGTGTWEVFFNGTSQGTATNTDHGGASYTSFAANSGQSDANIDVDWYAVDDGS